MTDGVRPIQLRAGRQARVRLDLDDIYVRDPVPVHVVEHVRVDNQAVGYGAG
jgi:hypothetical protein